MRELELSALQLFLEFGNEEDKIRAQRELYLNGYGTTQPTVEVLEEVQSVNDSDVESCVTTS
jgi:hypothetical protein